PPQLPVDLTGYDAVVVALKTRSIAKVDAVKQSLQAIRALKSLGVQRFLLKYCSTFDSTADGNIGPVTEALLDHLNASQTVLCPAFPANGRTQYLGYLFVDGVLLHESGMRDHPLTPMRDSNLRRVLAQQATKKIGLVDYVSVAGGKESIRECIGRLSDEHCQLLLTDALRDEDLASISKACAGFRLITGGAAIGGHMVNAWRELGLLGQERFEPEFPVRQGPTILFSGSCSQATQRQVRHYAESHPALFVDLLADDKTHRSAEQWALEHRDEAPLIYTTVDVGRLSEIQSQLGTQEAARRAENILAELADRLVRQGFGQMIVAGGETAGAIVRKLNIQAISIGPEICPGVPWTQAISPPGLSLALKSGNFGGVDFFEQAQTRLRNASVAT
ncbi:MAG: four-carbon acid sugar kinase family protein, partial [bacterium]|nr:four-carbon acid sugar kinase family protein [bacterium]